MASRCEFRFKFSAAHTRSDGIVLISHVDVQRVVLPRLQIIRGKTLFKMTNYDEEFALIVTTSKMFSLELPALRDVLSGSIGLFSNYSLCHVKTINWKDIMSDPNGRYVYSYNFSSSERECPPCHKNCVAGCWGEGEENCQKFSKENCSPQCYEGRCFGPNPRECCHLLCAGGCTGPKQSDCIACKNFYDDGVCTQECPPMQIYNPITYSWDPNPHGKYAYNATCVKNCPEHLLKDSGACVRACPPSKKAVNGECVPCKGLCPKTCKGDVHINARNIDNFKGCTIIEGSIHILENSFTGYQHIFPNFTFGQRYSAMHPDRLEVFSAVKEITGFLDIQSYHQDFKNLSYFRNLEIIGGRTLYDYFSALYIVKTSLESLNLFSLRKINSGTVAILENKHLCFGENINWRMILKSSLYEPILQNNGNAENCKTAGLVCNEQCSKDGCWGPGPDQCLTCLHFQLGNTCLQNCTTIRGLYSVSNNICELCDEECEASCSGPGPQNCTSCKNLKKGLVCIAECPISTYKERKECKDCHYNCIGGCTGPNNFVGTGGCKSCEKGLVSQNASMIQCLRKNETCPEGYYEDFFGTNQINYNLEVHVSRSICRKCHSRCKKCTGYGFHKHVCQKCRNYIHREQCEDVCPVNYYPDKSTKQCVPCNSECKECTGPGPDNCVNCKNFYDDGICRSECPRFYTYNTSSYTLEPNPQGKYAYGKTCVKNCPKHLLKDNGVCVRTCASNKTTENGECIPCNDLCPKTCRGGVHVNSGNIDSFRGCTVIEGYISILNNSFTGSQVIFPNLTFGERYTAMHPDRLEVFSTVKEITEFLNVQAYHDDFKNLSYFRNLEIIGGNAVYEYFSSLYIVQTSLKSFNMNSLKRINSGTVIIMENKHMCFIESINWNKLRNSSKLQNLVYSNRNAGNCTAEGLVCNEQCSKDGCWGAGSDQCLFV